MQPDTGHDKIGGMTFPQNIISIRIAYFCLFLSGAASLIYELVWIKQLTLVFGGTLYAISAVLCAFMTGLALGAWGISRYLDTRKEVDRIKLYGIVEGLIGGYGLLFPWGLKALSLAYPLAIGVSIDSSPALHLIEFILSTLLMLPSTLLMGATLPLVGSWAVGNRVAKLFSNVSILYSINTFGAVFGCLFAQYFGIERFGIGGVTWIAITLNVAVFLLSRQLPAEPEIAETPAAQKSVKRTQRDVTTEETNRPFSILLLAIFTFSGFASLSSEILWTRALVFPLGSTLYSFALILATFLFGIALGSLVAEKLLGNSRGAFKFLAIELAIGVFCIAMIPVFDLLPELTAKADLLFYDVQNTPLRTLLVRSLFAFGLMFLPTFGFGIIFPLANRIHISLFNTISGTLGNTYAVNTVGAVLGTLITPFLLIPLLGIRGSLFAIYSLLILLVCAALALHGKRTSIAASLTLGGILVFGGHVWSTPQINTLQLGQGNFARMEVNVPADRIRLLDYKEGDFATLSAVEDKETGARTLYVNGFSTATVSDSVGGSSYMQAMGFVPMALHPDPRQALVICFGTGNTLGTVALFPGVSVDGVEIDRNVLSFAHWFSRWNHDILKRPNARMSIQDGRSFIRWTNKTYDVITLEPMSPVHAGVTNLYSKEFYQLSSRHLAPNGIMMQWLPLHLVSPADARSIIKTFQEVFPHTSVWNSFLTRIVLLVGSNQPITLDKTRFDALMANPELRQLAEQMGVFSFPDFMDFYLAEGNRIGAFLQGADIISDDRPVLEYSSAALLPPLKWETDESFLNILRHRVNHFPPLQGDKSGLEEAFELRTAQRLAVFSQRYHGPGEQQFAAQEPLAGLSEIKDYLEKNKDALISLQDQQWRAIKPRG